MCWLGFLLKIVAETPALRAYLGWAWGFGFRKDTTVYVSKRKIREDVGFGKKNFRFWDNPDVYKNENRSLKLPWGWLSKNPVGCAVREYTLLLRGLICKLRTVKRDCKKGFVGVIGSLRTEELDPLVHTILRPFCPRPVWEADLTLFCFK